MKKLAVVIAVLSCFVFCMISTGWPAEQIQPPGGIVVIAKCPTGFDYKPISTAKSGFHCVRKKPANPCPQGYHVKWGTCASDCQGMAPPADKCSVCTFQCIPDLPAKPAYDCGPGYNLIVGFCEISCSIIPK